MPVTASDILLKLTTTAGSAGNTQAGTPAGSLGRYISTTQISGTPLNNLFDVVSGPENTAQESEYRAVAIHNSHATLTALDCVVWIAAEAAGGADITIGLDPAAPSAVGSSTAQGAQVANENAAPSGVTFTKPLSSGAGLSIGALAPGQVKLVWICRTATNSGPKNTDTFSLGFQCATGE